MLDIVLASGVQPRTVIIILVEFAVSLVVINKKNEWANSIVFYKMIEWGGKIK